MAYNLPSSETHTRLVTAPDGIDYLVALDGWYWNALDWMHAETDWKDTDFINGAWRVAKQNENDGIMENPGNLPAEFAAAFKIYIWMKMSDFIDKENGIANNNF